MILYSIEWSNTVKVVLLTILVIALIASVIILYFLLKNKKYNANINSQKSLFSFSELKDFAVVRESYKITKEQLYEAQEDELLSIYYDDEYAVGEYIDENLRHFEEIHPIMKSFGKFYKDEDGGFSFKLFDEPIDVVSKLQYPLIKRIVVNKKDNPKIIMKEFENQYIISLKKNNIISLELGVIEKNKEEMIVKINQNKKVLKNYSLYKEEILQIIEKIKTSYVTKK